MKYILPVVIMTVCASALYAQDTAYRSYTVKAYANASPSYFTAPYFNKYFGNNLQTTQRHFLTPSVAWTYTNKRKNQHEIEWNQLNISNTENKIESQDTNGRRYYQTVQKIRTTTIALRYEYILTLAKKKHWLLRPSIGFAAMPYYNRYNIIPYLTSDYHTSQTYIGVRHFVIPRINISLRKNILLDVNIPIALLDMGTIRQNIENPTLPARAQRYGVFDVNVLPRYFSARLGIAVKI